MMDSDKKKKVVQAATLSAGAYLFYKMAQISGENKDAGKVVEKDEGELKIAYWAIRGLAASLRMTCEYAEAKYTPFNYDAGDPSSSSYKQAWLKAKSQLKEKNPLMNLPYIEDGDFVVCQSNACLAYLGKKFNLYGKNLVEETKVHQCLDQLMDLRNAMVNLFYTPSLYEETKDTFIERSALPHLEKMENWLNSNGTIYCALDTPCVADFHLWELIDQLELFAKHLKQESPLKGKPKLEALYSNIRKLPQLSNYFNGDLYALPVNNPHALWK